VPIEIFKTANRGWGKFLAVIKNRVTDICQGLRCKVDLKVGQFVDTYRGEIITHEEVERRGRNRGPEEANYFFNFDRFEEESKGYVCDGKHMGGPSRFINHSCDPNCRIMTVSYNHADIDIYDLAFFANQVIPAGTELTFDYGVELAENLDDDEAGPSRITDTMADEYEIMKGYRPARCVCGSRKCRGYFFT